MEQEKKITIDFDNQPMAKEPMKGEVHRIQRKSKDPIAIDFDNYEPAKEPFLKTRQIVKTGLCGLADLDERQKTEVKNKH